MGERVAVPWVDLKVVGRLVEVAVAEVAVMSIPLGEAILGEVSTSVVMPASWVGEEEETCWCLV